MQKKLLRQPRQYFQNPEKTSSISPLEGQFAENTCSNCGKYLLKLRKILSEVAENTYKIEYFYLLHSIIFSRTFAA